MLTYPSHKNVEMPSPLLAITSAYLLACCHVTASIPASVLEDQAELHN